MQIFKYIIYGIIIGLINPPFFDCSLHIFILDKIFNTTIFNDQTFPLIANLGFLITIYLTFHKEINSLIKNSFLYLILPKEKKVKLKKYFKYSFLFIITSIPIILIKIINKPKLSILKISISLIITAIITLLFNNNKNTKKITDLKIKDIITITIIEFTHIFFNISHLITLLLGCQICKIKKDIALKISFIRYFFISLIVTLSNYKIALNIEPNLLLPYLIGTVVTAIFSHYTLIFIDELIKNKKLWKLAIYFFILAIFIVYWFR